MGWAGCFMTRMPGESHRGPLAPLTPRERDWQEELRRHVTELAVTIGPRDVYHRSKLAAAARYIESRLLDLGYDVARQEYELLQETCVNLEVTIRGVRRPEEIVVVGAHYDTVWPSPGANDNATGVAALLVLARAFHGREIDRTLRLVAFANEEPPFFQTDNMGSRVYARACRQRGDRIVAMFSLETMGYYSDSEKSQSYPFPFSLLYPSTGNFIAFVGNVGSASLVKDAIRSFRARARFPSEGGAIYGGMPGIGWSDHWSFWQEDYPALMITDTAPFRYPHYHGVTDTPDRILFDRLARVVSGLEKMLADFVLLPQDG